MKNDKSKLLRWCICLRCLDFQTDELSLKRIFGNHWVYRLLKQYHWIFGDRNLSWIPYLQPLYQPNQIKHVPPSNMSISDSDLDAKSDQIFGFLKNYDQFVGNAMQCKHFTSYL